MQRGEGAKNIPDMKMAMGVVLLVATTAFGQTRTDELERQRAEHTKQIAPEETSKAEEVLRRLKDDKTLQRINYGYNGLGLRMGGLVTGGGFAVGPQYLRDDLKDGDIVVRASAQISTRNYQKATAQLLLPRLADGLMSFDIQGTYRNYPGIQYYGPGPDSQRVRTNYRREDTSFDGAVSVSPVKFFRAGVAAGLLLVNVGPGTDDRFASAEQVFPPAVAIGIDQQTDFYRYGGFGQFDWRDDPFGPRQGGNYVVQYTKFKDRDLGMHDFNLLDIDLQQYLGFLNRSRVIALRAHARLTDTRTGQVVPFYLQPVIGGSDDLRGFRPLRFSGNNSLALTAEYRWAIFSGCDGALFVDGGKVFNRRGHLNFNDLEGSAGFGLRFNARNRTFIRVDVGFSHEGFQVWFKFNDIFQQRALGTAETLPIL